MTYQMMNPTSCELINLECVDEWLENDLIESGIILADEKEPAAAASMTPAQVLMASPPTSNCTPIMTPLIEASTPLLNYKPVSPIETPKITPQEMPKNSIDLEPFIKALVLLGSLQNPQQQQQKQNLDNDQDQLNKGVKRERTEDMTKEEIIALKRQRNTDAARRSRLRKSLKMESLEKQVAELEMENEKLKLHLAVSESERVNVEAKEKQSTLRVMELERQLVDAHSVLLRHTTTALKV